MMTELLKKAKGKSKNTTNEFTKLLKLYKMENLIEFLQARVKALEIENAKLKEQNETAKEMLKETLELLETLKNE